MVQKLELNARDQLEILLETIPEFSPKSVNWTKIQQCEQRPEESIWTIILKWEGGAKQYAGLRLESFSKHQNDPLLNSTFKEGLDEDLATLV